MEGVIAEYGADEENTNEVDASMALLFSARVCVGHLSRIDDCRQYAFCVGSQQLRGVGSEEGVATSCSRSGLPPLGYLLAAGGASDCLLLSPQRAARRRR